jgi:predicted HTH transcriptional regulator
LNISTKIQQPEGRRLEFKEVPPTNAELARTIVSFANDAGGELFIGIKNNPREITGLLYEQLDAIENKISNIVNDQCTPIVLPEITFIEENSKHIIRVYICKGSKSPYFITSKGKEKGTFIRVGSSNRLANAEIIQELERQGQNISFDSVVYFHKKHQDIDINTFKNAFKEKTSEALTTQILKKLELVKEEQGQSLPTNALVLLSEDKVRNQIFPNAKIECARFKGVIPGAFIDQKTIGTSISLQPEEAYQFVLRHISQGTQDYQGVYRNDRWEYPIIAIREVIRNAVIHRDYSLTGKDIKIAIFDDKLEITSPGKLLPSVDFNDMDAGQSDVRNKVLAPVFKRLGIIEQWGNGLQLIADDLKEYPEIALTWKEPGIAFRVSFINKNYASQQESQLELQLELRHELEHELEHELQHELEHESLFSKTLQIVATKTIATKEIALALGQKSISGYLKKVIGKLLEQKLIEWTIPETPKSSKQQYKITKRGVAFLQLLHKKNE